MSNKTDKEYKIAVVIPCYLGRTHIMGVLAEIPEVVADIFCVDDACPENTGKFIESECQDKRVKVIYHDCNQGVGGAMVTGYRMAMAEGADIIIKLDSDGQMAPKLIPRFLDPIITGAADYTKGNRFFRLESLTTMPKLRLLGNAVLSFMSKFSTGYWRLFDPNNGYTAIHVAVLRLMPLDKISKDYFFESDMLFRLNILRAVVIDIPMDAQYGNESSNLSIKRSVGLFFYKHTGNFIKRIFYNYYLRDFNIATIEWLAGPLLMLFGVSFGAYKWVESVNYGVAATPGTVMLAALPTLIGLQLLLSAMNYDIENTPVIPLSRLLNNRGFN